MKSNKMMRYLSDPLDGNIGAKRARARFGAKSSNVGRMRNGHDSAPGANDLTHVETTFSWYLAPPLGVRPNERHSTFASTRYKFIIVSIEQRALLAGHQIGSSPK